MEDFTVTPGLRYCASLRTYPQDPHAAQVGDLEELSASLKPLPE